MKLDIKSTHFIKNKLSQINPLSPESYRFLEDPIAIRKGVDSVKKRKSESLPRGFKPSSTFPPHKPDLLNPPGAYVNSELQYKLTNFFKFKKRVHSITRPIDPSESQFASGGPSNRIIRERIRNRRNFVAQDAREALMLGGEPQADKSNQELEIDLLQEANSIDPSLKLTHQSFTASITKNVNDPPEDAEDNLTERRIKSHRKKTLQPNFDPAHRKSPFLSTRI